MSIIDDKYKQLKTAGLDLGADLHPGAADMDAGYGGTYRQYKNGNIYFHSGVSPQAHEVHGGILSLYLAHGGPGVDAATGKRLFGFPKSDEVTSENKTPMNTFEWAAIYWTEGTGGVTLTGSAYTAFVAGGQSQSLGLPLTSNVAVAGGEAIYCERGVAWATDAVPNAPVVGRFNPPLLGSPLILNPTPTLAQQSGVRADIVKVNSDNVLGQTQLQVQPFLPDVIQFERVVRATYDAVTKLQPNVFTSIWANRLSLIDTGTRKTRIALDAVITESAVDATSASITCKLSFENTSGAQDNTLYDLELALPKAGSYYPISPHAVYLKKDWTDFGLLHITDSHLSLRNEQLRGRLTALGLTDAAANYTNTGDQFRDFVRYANHLHSIGLAHAVMATGDLIDYIAEPGDDPYGISNFKRLRNTLLGLPFDSGLVAGEELLLPIFTTLGNHDHRLYPYDLHCKLDISKDAWKAALDAVKSDPLAGVALGVAALGEDIYDGWEDLKGLFGGSDNNSLSFDINNYATFNLKTSEVDLLQGTVSNGKHVPNVPVFGADQFNQALTFLKQAISFPYLERYFGPRSNKVALGPHRLVVLDSGPDAGVPQNAAPADLPKIAIGYLDGGLPRSTIELATGCPNSTGYGQGQLDILQQALSEAGSSGVVIVGVHLPPIAPTHGYNDYFRETEHPTADPSHVNNYVASNKLPTPANWSPTGTPYFASGDVIGTLDYGIGVGNALAFLKLCAGVGQSRPIDLLLCGHHHDRVEYRMRWDQATSKLQYFIDFYSENPAAYYATDLVTRKGSGSSYTDNPTRIVVDPKAKVGGVPGDLVYVQPGQKPVNYQTLTVPPYADPLNSSTNASAWWQAHRPLLMQTSALGPIDPCQRFDDPTDPEPTFQGFRLVQVSANVIQKIRYITNKELRAANFVMPWESVRIPVGVLGTEVAKAP